MTAVTETTGIVNSLTAGRLPRWATWVILGASWATMIIAFALVAASSGAELNIGAALFLGTILFIVLIFVFALLVEGIRQAKDRLVTALVISAFLIALIPLISLLFTVVSNGSRVSAATETTTVSASNSNSAPHQI